MSTAQITCRSGQAALLHSEAVLTRLKHKGFQAICELLHIRELSVPAFERKHRALLHDPELLVCWSLSILSKQTFPQCVTSQSLFQKHVKQLSSNSIQTHMHKKKKSWP